MTPSEGEHLKSLFEAAIELAPEGRAEFIEEACGNDAALRAELERLIAEHERAGGGLLEAPALRIDKAPTEGRQPHAFSPEQVVAGRFRILRFIGEGGMGEVYEARDLELSARVALKTVRAQLASDDRTLARFRQEIQLARKVTHPNVCRIFDVHRHEQVTFLTMELLEGETLSDRLRRKGRMETSEAQPVVKQMADGLEAAHRAGIIHRDFKSANVMLVPSSDSGTRAVVTDFGLARSIEPDDTEGVTASAGGHIIGTPAYMAPEQFEGGPITPATDVYALGVVLYEMVAGERPFSGRSPLAAAFQRVRQQPPSARLLVPDLDPKWDAAITRCLARDAAERFQRAPEVVGALEGRAADAPSPVIKPDPGPRPWLPWVVAATLVLALALAGIWRFVPAARLAAQRLLGIAAIPTDQQIAVLPFQNIGGDPANQAFCDGLIETVTSMLGQLEQSHGALRVVPASEIRSQSISSARDAHRIFGVNLVLTGSVQFTGNRIVLTANLVDAVALRQLDARTLVTSREDLTTLQDGAITQVAGLLKLKLQPQTRQLLLAGGTVMPGAYDFYLQGRGYLQRPDRAGSLDSAKSLFEKALERDPNYALAYAGLAEAYLAEYGQTKDPQFLEKARTAASRTVKLDEHVAQAYVNLGIIYSATGRHQDAVKEFERALNLDPVNSSALRGLAKAYEGMGKLKDAEETYKKAIEMRPSDWLGHSDLGVFYFNHGRYTDAEAPFRRVVELTPDNHIGPRNLGGVYYLLGRYTEAAEMLERSLRVRPTAGTYSNLGTVYFAQGRYRDAVPMMEKAIELGGERYSNDYILWANLADAYNAMPEYRAKAPGAYQRAIQAAERQLAVNPSDASLVGSVAVDRAKLGEKQRALLEIEKARRLLPGDQKIGFQSILVYEICGQRARALTGLKGLVQRGYPVEEIRRAPELKELRRDARYERLMADAFHRETN